MVIIFVDCHPARALAEKVRPARLALLEGRSDIFIFFVGQRNLQQLSYIYFPKISILIDFYYAAY